MPLSSLVGLNVQASLSQSLDLGAAKYDVTKTYSTSFSNGTAAGQADKVWTDSDQIAASGTRDLDLNGVLTDAFGGVLGLVRVKALIVAASAGNVNDVVVGGAAANQWLAPFGSATDKIKVKPGGTLALFAGLADATGWPVVASTGDVLRIANGGAGSVVNYDIMIIGASA